MISIEDFMKVELKVAVIKDIEDHPDADRLYVIKIELEDGETRQLVAGIRPSYERQELVGKQIVVVTNLEPATIRGVESQGMILAASDDKGMSVITPHRDVALGSRIK